MIKKLLCVVMFLTWSLQIKAEINQSTIFVLGSLDKETKQLFKETIYDQIHNYAQTISIETQSNIYVFPYQNQNQWQVVSLHVQGNENHSYLLDLSLEGHPLRSLDEIRQLVGLDGSLKYIGWSSYDELPPEKVFIASKIIAQDYLYLYFKKKFYECSSLCFFDVLSKRFHPFSGNSRCLIICVYSLIFFLNLRPSKVVNSINSRNHH